MEVITDEIKIQITQDDGSKRTIGNYKRSNNTLYLVRNRRKHFYWKFKAWGIDEEAFMNLITEYGMKYLIITELNSQSRFIAKASDFIENGIHLHFKPHRKQLFLEEKYWEII